MSKDKMTWREEREQAFILVFQQLINRNTTGEITDVAEESAEICIAEFAKRFASGVEKNNAVVDDKIEKNIRDQSTMRPSKVSFALLRVAIYEMMSTDSIPASVSIDEVVDLAKKYGGTDGAPFINSVLGSVAKELEPANEKR